MVGKSVVNPCWNSLVSIINHQGNTSEHKVCWRHVYVLCFALCAVWPKVLGGKQENKQTIVEAVAQSRMMATLKESKN